MRPHLARHFYQGPYGTVWREDFGDLPSKSHYFNTTMRLPRARYVLATDRNCGGIDCRCFDGVVNLSDGAWNRGRCGRRWKHF